MVGFRGLDWIYDVTSDTNTIVARAQAFERQIASMTISQPSNDSAARVRLTPLQTRRPGCGDRIESSSGDRRRRMTEHRQASAA